MSAGGAGAPASVITAEFDGETVLLDLDAGHYHARASAGAGGSPGAPGDAPLRALGCAAEPMPLNPGLFGDPLILVTI